MELNFTTFIKSSKYLVETIPALKRLVGISSQICYNFIYYSLTIIVVVVGEGKESEARFSSPQPLSVDPGKQASDLYLYKSTVLFIFPEVPNAYFISH